MAKVAVAKRRAKRLAGASVVYSNELGSWLQSLYSMVNGMVAPFGLQMYATEAEAIAEANKTLKTADGDWVEVPEDEVDKYMAEHTRNQWATRQDPETA